MYWDVELEDIHKECLEGPYQKNVVVVMTYVQLCDDPKICFMGMYPRDKPDPDDWVLLGVVLQKGEGGLLLDTCYPVKMAKTWCHEAKNNIVKSSKHHDSHGFIYGFGFHKEMGLDGENGSSMKECKSKKKGVGINKEIQEALFRSMEYTRDMVTKNWVGHDLHLDNSAPLLAGERQAFTQGIQEDFHMLGKTGYTSCFFNFDASTMNKHTEMDWCMTTIYMPPQKWKNKNEYHLNFLFHLTGNDDGCLAISMKPGTVIYFYGYLLTHQQVHRNGKVTHHGCCLNFSGYTNKCLQSHLQPTLNCTLYINENL